jgi:hypothetical protein
VKNLEAIQICRSVMKVDEDKKGQRCKEQEQYDYVAYSSLIDTRICTHIKPGSDEQNEYVVSDVSEGKNDYQSEGP